MIRSLPKRYLYGAVAVAVLAFGLWLRWDAVRDYQADLTTDRLEQIQDARTIEYETRSDTDDALITCLRGAGC
ncbi:hypothetical protein [Neptunicoccus cionae]|uniref:Uncharacterized protein n=1 Tax=Neptunicoccus cionae TaxID=2035344 RepID=A0A916R2W4_9RHOB|nr:hypothetical protein [Amylibacter cionae]GGA23853.1 hypothetical protein GCM10011498_25970 [Amylibacter cionae]